MKIKVDDIKAKPVTLSATEPASAYPAIAELSESEECEFVAPISIAITAMLEFDHIRVEGSAATKIKMHCSRCLEEYETDISAVFTLFYNKTSGEPIDAEMELQEHDLLSISYEGDYIDFTSEIEAQMLMAVPYKPLCDSECKGLCSKCGANLNEGDCGCGHDGPGFKFAALKDFKVKK